MPGLPPVDPFNDVEFLSVGHPGLDDLLGGGIPLSRLIHIYGDKDSGKTTFASYFLVLLQKRHPTKKVAYIDTERHLSKGRLQEMGVDVSPERFRYHTAGTTERVVELLIELAESDEICGIVIDSLANTDSNDAIGNSDSYKTDGKGGFKSTTFAAKNPNIIQGGIKKLASLQAKREGDNALTVLVVNQIRQNIGVMYGPTTRTPGGFNFHFNTTVDINLYAKPTPVMEDDVQTGIELRIRIPRSKYTTGYTLPYTFDRGDGLYIPFKNAIEEIEFQKFYKWVVDNDWLEAKGAWFTLTVNGTQVAKVQGKGVMMSLLRDPDMQEKIRKAAEPQEKE